MRLLVTASILFHVLAFGDDKAALEAAIAAHPDEDTPRLMYADWLEEHGEVERAEFIRVQIELSRLTPADSKYAGLKARENKLVQDRNRWIPDGLNLAGFGDGLYVEWKRGFIEGVDISRLETLASSEVRSAIDALPLLRSLTIDLQKSQMAYNETGAAIDSFLRFKSLPRLRHLRLSGLPLANVHVQRLADAPLDSLRSFDMGISDFTEHDGSIRFFTAPWLAKLHSLEFLRAGVAGSALAVGSENTPELLHLSLPQAFWVALAGGKGAPKLKSLTLVVRQSHAADIASFLNSKRFEKLSELRLYTWRDELNPSHPEETPWLREMVTAIANRGKHLAVFEVHRSHRYIPFSPDEVLVPLPAEFAAHLKANAANLCSAVVDKLGS